MVSYQAWVSIVFETLQDRGVEATDIDDGATIMEFAATSWNDHRRRLRMASAAEARTIALRLARTY